MTKPHKNEEHQNPKPPEASMTGDTPEPVEGAAPADGTAAAPESAAAPEATQEPLVGLTLSEYTELQKKISDAEQKSREYFEGWQRERADFLNYRRRIERENLLLHQNLTGQIIKKYLVVLDDLERALKSRPSQGDGADWSQGVELISRKLATILEAEGIKPIEAAGAMFDPLLHEAITHEDSPDHQSGQIIEVVQQGYLLGERVLRPALVRVAR
jgi:molecular chaperone GrpE